MFIFNRKKIRAILLCFRNKNRQQKVSDLNQSNTVETTTNGLHTNSTKANTSFPHSISASSNDFQSTSMNTTTTTFASPITKSLPPIDYASTFNGFSNKAVQQNRNSILVQSYLDKTALENSRLSSWAN